jgi:hypothetical protein
MSIEVRAFDHKDKATFKDFREVVCDIFRDDPHWIRPLDMDLQERFNPKKNPFFDHAEVGCWVAYKEGQRVGRITAQVDREHLKRFDDDVGFFGFFDTVDDEQVAQALLNEAQRWLLARGCKRMRGPVSLSLHEECGCLIDGFDSPPMLIMPHHRPYQAGLIEGAGVPQLKELYAWKYDMGSIPARALKGHQLISELPEVTARPINMKRLAEDMAMVMAIYNDAWGDNWGFVPATDREVDKTCADLKLIAIPELTRLVFVDGEPAALAMAMPDLNEIIADFNGKLFPLNFVKLLWRLKMRGPRRARLFMLGIKKKYRAVRRLAGLSAYLYVEIHRAGEKLGVKEGELSWTLEDNAAINVGIKMMGARVYKRYGVFEKEIEK